MCPAAHFNQLQRASLSLVYFPTLHRQWGAEACLQTDGCDSADIEGVLNRRAIQLFHDFFARTLPKFELSNKNSIIKISKKLGVLLKIWVQETIY